MDIPNIQTGLTGTARRRVRATDLAPALGSGTVDVFGTPALVALMEEAAVNALADALPSHLTSVGVYLEIRHLAATPAGMGVQASATVTSVEGRTITFDVQASDNAEPIGRGTHKRVIVDSAKFQRDAEAKLSES